MQVRNDDSWKRLRLLQFVPSETTIYFIFVRAFLLFLIGLFDVDGLSNWDVEDVLRVSGFLNVFLGQSKGCFREAAGERF